MGLYVFNWPIPFRWLTGYIYSSCYYYHQMGSINLTYCYHIFPWLCACGACYIIFTYCIYIPRKPVQIVGCVLACRFCSFICIQHHLIIISVQTSLKTLDWWNACHIYSVECVSENKHILSVIHYIIYWAVCFQITHLSGDDWENIYFVLLSSSNRQY